MKHILALALLFFSQAALASTITYSWVNATTDVNGNAVPASDILSVTVQCGLVPGLYEPFAPFTVNVPSVNSVPATSTAVTWTDTSVTQLYCSMTTTNSVGVGPSSGEISFDPNQSVIKSLINAPSMLTIIVSP